MNIFLRICLIIIFSISINNLYAVKNFYGEERTDLSLYYGNGYKLAPQKQAILRTEHFDDCFYGDNYIYMDTFNPITPSTYLLGIWRPRFSLSKITKHSFQSKFFKDIFIATEFDAANGYRAYDIGIGFKLNFPNFYYENIDIYVHNTPHVPGVSYHLHAAYMFPFRFLNLKFEHGLNIEYYNNGGIKRQNTSPSLIFQPEVALDLGQFWNYTNHFYFGIRYDCWKNIVGFSNTSFTVPEAMLRWFF